MNVAWARTGGKRRTARSPTFANLMLMNFRLSRFRRVGNIQLVTFLKRTLIFFPCGNYSEVRRMWRKNTVGL